MTTRLDVEASANQAVDYDFDADGTLAKSINGRGVETQYGYDELNRLTTTTRDVGGSDPSTANTLQANAYDSQDNLVEVTDPNEAQTRYEYDDLGFLVRLTSPDTGLTTYQNDAAGNRTGSTDARGQGYTYTYDVLNRLVSADGPGNDHDMSFVYDSCANGDGQLCAQSRGNNHTAYTYNRFGETTSIEQTVQSLGLAQTSSLGMAYDGAGRLQTLSYPGNVSVTYGYDALGQVSQVTMNRAGQVTTLLSDLIYEPFGPLKSMTLGNGIIRHHTYDQAYRMSAINDPVYDTVLDYDANGNIVFQARSDGSDQDAGYDQLDRLISANDALYDAEYQYDRNGNRSELTENLISTTYGYEYASNRLASIGGAPVNLDANGNTTLLRGMVLAYSPDNRLVSLTREGVITRYTYNAAGERVAKVGTDKTSLFHYGLEGQLKAELNSSGQLVKAYVHANGQPVAVVDYSTSPLGRIYYIHTDHLGTPQGLSDETGTVVWRARYQPFGLATVDEDPDQDGTAITFNLRFPGQQFDEESGLHYNYYRDYDPNTGRYIESDPIGLEGGANVYVYGDGNPLVRLDVYGLTAIDNWSQTPSMLRNFPTAFRNLPLAGGAAAADGPLPIGEIIAVGLIIGSVAYDICRSDNETDNAPSARDCSKAKKLLKEAVRIFEKGGKSLPESRKSRLQQLVNDGTITSADLPGSVQAEFPAKLRGKSLNEINEICKRRR